MSVFYLTRGNEMNDTTVVPAYTFNSRTGKNDIWGTGTLEAIAKCKYGAAFGERTYCSNEHRDKEGWAYRHRRPPD